MEKETAHSPYLRNPRNIVVFLVGILLVSALILFYVLGTSNNSDNENTSRIIPTQQPENFLADGTVIYGAWDDKNSHIYAYDLSTGKDAEIAQLPTSIKKVIVLSADTLLFINKTNTRDHGEELATYSLSSKKTTPVYTATNGFVIDDYVISPNKKYIAVWEVQINEESGILLDGKSRVYTAQIGGNKNLIYDEISDETHPVHYPRAVLNNGKVFMDSFMPNSGAGWAYGMTVADFNGQNLSNIDGMAEGQYGTQPNLSPDGRFLAYGAYNGSQGDGKSEKDGYRQALLTPNVIEILNTTTLERTKVVGLQSSNVYRSVNWGYDSNELILSVLSPTEGGTGTYRYNLSNNTIKKIENESDKRYIASFPNGTELHGIADLSSSSIGNLGDTYSAPYTSMVLVDPQSQQGTDLILSTNFAQYIGIVPGKYYSLEGFSKKSRQNLQLQAFYFKTELAPTREQQQSNSNCRFIPVGQAPEGCPRCRELSLVQCESIGANFMTCAMEGAAAGICYDSPLYLYGKEGLHVDISIHTPIHNDSPKSQDGKYSVVLGTNGSFSYLEGSHNSIEYDYTSAIKKFPRLKQGYLVPKANVKDTVKNIAKQFGFNEKETNDTIRDISSKVASPYAFISFYDHKTSQAILPITFDPKPDVYRNIVFYVKNLDQKPNYSIQPPTIEKIKRHGFTAIEISGIIE